MRAQRRTQVHSSYEFELDLAPLLAVMVKLVPVLLLSSAFVQVMMIESDLPQVVKEAIAQNDATPEKATIQLQISNKNGFVIQVKDKGQVHTAQVPLKDSQYDLAGLHATLQKVKHEHPEIFKIELAPEGDVKHKDLVRAMDEARRSRDRSIVFPVKAASGEQQTTDFMFPDVVFVNVLEG